MDIILFILVLGINILIHEFAHFYFARKANILCHEFAIGMGPVLYQKKKGETVYSIRAIPLGGYVSMAGEEVSDFVKIGRSEEHTSELQSRPHLVCRLLLEKKKNN